jgi:uncharacterized membrane protein
MELLFKIILGFHITAGSIALLSGPVAMFSKKGGENHRLAGKFFTWSMAVVSIAALYLSIAHKNWFLLMVAVFSMHSIVIGYRFLYLKKIQLLKKPTLLDWLIALPAALFSMGLVVFGILLLIQNQNSFGWVAIVFGSIGSRNAWVGIRPFYIKPKQKNFWLINHISGMIGGYIATFTAFLVVNISFQPSFILWLLPTLIGVPFIFYNIRKYKSESSKTNTLTVRINT